MVSVAASDIQQPSQSRAIRLMRVPVSGGARELVMQFPASMNYNLDCPIQPKAQCIIQQGAPDGNQATFVRIRCADSWKAPGAV